MKRRSRTVLAALVVAGCTGCAMPGEIPQLVHRSVLSVQVTVETDPPGARIFGEDLLSIGTAPITKRWEVERLVWSDGANHFRLLPKGLVIRPGDELTFELTARADGYEDEFRIVRVPFKGQEDNAVSRIALRKAKGGSE